MLTKQQLKIIKSLSKLKHRQKYNIFIVEGYKAVYDLVQDVPDRVEYLIMTKAFHIKRKKVLESYMGKIYLVEDKEYASISGQSTPSGIMAIAKCAEHRDSSYFNNNVGLSLYLDGINDPGNMGTILRIADWYDVNQVILPKGNVDIYNSKVVQSAMGSLWRHNYIYASYSELDLSNITALTSCMEGEPIRALKLRKEANLMLVMGNESNGVSKEIMESENIKITIPKQTSSSIDSLNVGVAAAIILDSLVS